MAHAAAWLAKAYEGNTVADTYLSESEAYLDHSSIIWALEWDDKRGLVNV